MMTNGLIYDVELSGKYGDAVADFFDLIYPGGPVVDDCVDGLAELAGKDGSLLEFGVGTGRVARPLAQRGVQVVGLDASRKMLDRLRANDPDQTVETIHASFGTVDLERRFDVVAATFNSLCCATSQEDQIATLRTMRRHLAPGGRVVLETFDPARQHAQREPSTRVQPLGPARALIESIQVMPEAQLMVMTNTILAESGPEIAVGFMRYIWPSELDAMAQLAGLTLESRWGSWKRGAFTVDNQLCVSVYAVTDA